MLIEKERPMLISRRDFLKYCIAMAGALGLEATGLANLQEVLASESGPPVVWLQAQGCSGCSVSLLNTIHYMTIDHLLLNTIDLEFHPTVMAAAGDLAVSAAESVYGVGGYVLVVEGAIPIGDKGKYCYLWPGMTALDAVKTFSEKAAFILAVGSCAAYGGMPAGAPNPTLAKGVGEVIGKPVINLPGCPAHPDWIVGTIAYLLSNGEIPRLDNVGRPDIYFQSPIHSQCPNKDNFHAKKIFATELSDSGCLYKLGCKGKETHSDCPMRMWNSGAGVSVVEPHARDARNLDSRTRCHPSIRWMASSRSCTANIRFLEHNHTYLTYTNLMIGIK
jgi:hydrogenase small subunit